jgi:hypothetical protein
VIFAVPRRCDAELFSHENNLRAIINPFEIKSRRAEASLRVLRALLSENFILLFEPKIIFDSILR